MRKSVLLACSLFVVLYATSCKQGDSKVQVEEPVRITAVEDGQLGIILCPGVYSVIDTIVSSDNVSKAVYVYKNGLRDKEYWVSFSENENVVTELSVRQVKLSYTPVDSSEDADESMKTPRINAWNTERQSNYRLTYSKDGVMEVDPALKFKSCSVSDSIPLVGRHYNFSYEGEGTLPTIVHFTDWEGNEYEYKLQYTKDGDGKFVEVKIDYYLCAPKNGDTPSSSDLINSFTINNFQY
jgi:hypothetical protein